MKNETLSLDENESAELVSIKSKERNLPFFIEERKFIADSYIIGEVQLSNCLIRILPRHDALSLAHFFEMLLYINRLNDKSISSTSYSYQKTFGVESLVENFIDYCESLISFGLTGIFNQNILNSHKPSGRIKFGKFKKQLIPIEGITIEQEKYYLDCYPNQILKSALEKINSFRGLNKLISLRVKSLLGNFDNISIYNMDPDKLRIDVVNSYSSNKFYPICLEYALKILLDFRLGYNSSSDFQWNAFLENSNDIFEKYVRAILERELANNVCKWDTPMPFAELTWNGKTDSKSYTPDILIDYNNGKARAVFDAKNKHFNPELGNLGDIVSVADIYQLEFYANQLNSEVCGLIYPSKGNFPPIKLELKGIDRKFFLISIDMTQEFFNRKSIFVENIVKCLNYT